MDTHARSQWLLSLRSVASCLKKPLLARFASFCICCVIYTFFQRFERLFDFMFHSIYRLNFAKFRDTAPLGPLHFSGRKIEGLILLSCMGRKSQKTTGKVTIFGEDYLQAALMSGPKSLMLTFPRPSFIRKC